MWSLFSKGDTLFKNAKRPFDADHSGRSDGRTRKMWKTIGAYVSMCKLSFSPGRTH
jgi:hypothetical protein